jgi:hypothetical protein
MKMKKINRSKATAAARYDLKLKLADICPKYDLRYDAPRKLPKRNVFQVLLRSQGFDNPALAETRSTGGLKGNLVEALKAQFTTVQVKYGCADSFVCIHLG